MTVMINEDYVSFETAKLLKEKRFDWLESPFYSEQDRDEWRQNNSYTIPNMEYNPDLPFDSETLTMVAPHVSTQIAMKWLREKYKITIGVLFKGDRIYYEINQNNEFVFGVDTPESYEKVCDEAIKYCLKILI